jgi:hypothetical protein
MRRALLLAAVLLALAASPVATAEEVRVGPCEVDACLYACVDVREPCPQDGRACVLFAFRVWCV